MTESQQKGVRLAQTFVELADSLVDDFDVVDLMVLLTERCVELLDANAAGLLLADAGGTLHLLAATSEAIETVELFQIQSDEGPCRDCFHSGAPVSALNLAEEGDRWPRFAPVAAAAGFRAAHAFPLRLRGRVLGAMNLFRTEPIALSASDIATARALTDVATIAVIQSQEPRRRQGGGRSAPGGAPDEDRHRAGEGHPRPEARRETRRGVRPAAPARAKQFDTTGRRRPGR